MAERIFDTDSYYDMAKKIYRTFDIGMSCAVTGFLEMPDGHFKPKGDIVLDQLRKFDELDNVNTYGKKRRRKSVLLPNTIGGYVAHKIFQYKINFIDNEPRYTIWRIQ